MDRGATAAMVAELTARRSIPFYLFEADLTSGPVRNCSLSRDVVFQGNTFTGNGHFVSFEALEETAQLQVKRVKVTLSGIDQTWVSLVLAEAIRIVGREIRIWLGAISESTGTLIQDPFLLFAGEMDRPVISDEPGPGGSTFVTVEATNFLADWDRPRGRRTNNQDSQLHFPGDRSFEFIDQIDKQQKWGAP